jgi:hypothetical protein
LQEPAYELQFLIHRFPGHLGSPQMPNV